MLSLRPPGGSYALGDRYAARRAAYRTVQSAGAKIGKWAKRQWEQRKSRQGKTAARRSQAKRAIVGVQQEQGGGSGDSKSFTAFGRFKSKRNKGFAESIVGQHVVRRSGSSTASCAQAVQNVMLLNVHLDAADVSNLYTSLSQTSSIYNASKLYIKRVVADTMMTNASSLHIYCTIYDCIAKLDGFTTVNTSAAVAFTLGGADAGGGAAADYTALGTTPWDNPRFLASYRIIKQTPLVLAAGQTHTHTVKYEVNRVINKERVTLNGSGPIAGLTVYSMVVFHGTPVHDLATEGTITSGVAKLDTVNKEGIYYTQVLYPAPFNSISTSLAAVTSPEQWTEEVPADTLNVT